LPEQLPGPGGVEYAEDPAAVWFRNGAPPFPDP